MRNTLTSVDELTKAILTWIVFLVAVGASASDAVGFEKSPISEESDASVCGTAGHNFELLARAAIDKPSRDNFETADQFQRKLDDWIRRPVYGAVSLNSRIVLKSTVVDDDNLESGFRYIYDPDRQLVRLETHGGVESIPGSGKFGAPFIIRSSISNNGQYIGSNAFGKQVLVRKRSVVKFQVVVQFSVNPNEFSTQHRQLRLEEARDALRNPNAYVIGRLIPPYGQKTIGRWSPTIESPVDEETSVRSLYIRAEEVVLCHARNPSLELLREKVMWNSK